MEVMSMEIKTKKLLLMKFSVLMDKCCLVSPILLFVSLNHFFC